MSVKVASAITLALLAATGASSQEHQHGAAPAAPPAGATAPLFTQEDLMFLTHMIVHHQQALEMAAMVPSRSQREAFIRFARYVDGAQRAEIDQMQGLLRLAAERG